MLSYLTAPRPRFYQQLLSGGSGHVLPFSNCAGLALTGVLLVTLFFPSVASAVKAKESHTAEQKTISLQQLARIIHD